MQHVQILLVRKRHHRFRLADDALSRGPTRGFFQVWIAGLHESLFHIVGTGDVMLDFPRTDIRKRTEYRSLKRTKNGRPFRGPDVRTK